MGWAPPPPPPPVGAPVGVPGLASWGQRFGASVLDFFLVMVPFSILLGALGLIDAATMLRAWRWVVLASALAGAVLTPSTDPVTMLLLAGAITALYLVGVGLVALTGTRRPAF